MLQVDLQTKRMRSRNPPNAALNAIFWSLSTSQGPLKTVKVMKLSCCHNLIQSAFLALRLVKGLDHGVLVLLDRAGPHSLAQFEHGLNHAQLRRSRVQTGHGHPVIDHHASAHDGTAAIDTARYQRHLQQTRQLILILNRRLGMHDPALIRQRHV